MTQPVDHSVLIEQLESWVRRLEAACPPFTERGYAVQPVIKEMRQVAADLTAEDAAAKGEART